MTFYLNSQEFDLIMKALDTASERYPYLKEKIYELMDRLLMDKADRQIVGLWEEKDGAYE